MGVCNHTTDTSNASCKVEILQGVAYTPLMVVGLLVNAAALRASVALKASRRTDTHIYVINLAIADSALILFLPFRIYDAFFCLPKTFFCTFLINTHFINMYASILTTTAISVHRYLAIRFPMQARAWRRKKQTAVLVCLGCWGFLLTTCAVFREENYPDKLWTCYERCKNHRLRLQFLLIMVLLGFLIPLLIVVFCSTQIICILSKKEEEEEEAKMEERKSTTIGIVTANMIVFIVCYTPIHVAFVVNYLYTPPPNWPNEHMPAHMFMLVSEWVASTNCCLDCIGYYFLLKWFYRPT